jgi:hypothetical protein
VSELESERWIGESGLTATNVIGPAQLALGPLVDCAGVAKGLTRSDDSTTASAGLQLCRVSARETRTGAQQPPA